MKNCLHLFSLNVLAAVALLILSSAALYAQVPPESLKYRTFNVIDFRQASVRTNVMGYTVKGKVPNAGNIRDSVFTDHGFSWESPEDGGFLRVGHRFTDSSRYYGWFFYYRWFYNSPEVRFYIFSPTALKKSPNYLTLRGEVKTTTYFGNAGNGLTQQMTALKTNIAASDMGLTPPGFGDLVFDQASGPETILNGRTLRQIVMLGDSAMTLGAKQRTAFPILLINILHTVAARINNEFYAAAIDTVSTSPLVIKGTKLLSSVPYLKYDPSRLMPWNKSRTSLRMNRETAMEITGYKLQQNFPNPFNPATTISYQLPEESHVKVTVFDAVGRLVTTLVNEVQSAGDQYQTWNAGNLTSGVYFYRIEARSAVNPVFNFVQTKKMLLVK